MRGAIAAWGVLDERRALRLGTRRNTRRYKTRRGTRRDRGGGEDGGGGDVFSVVIFSCAVISHH